MKQTLFLLLLSYCFFISCSSSPKLHGRYVSDLQDTFLIEKTGTIINSKRQRDNQLIVKQRGDILKFKTTWYMNRLLNRPHKLYFKILDNTNDRIILLPITRWSKIMFENRDSISLRKDSSYQ